MHQFNIEFYTDIHGRQPAQEFLLNLDNKKRAKMLRMREIDRAKEYRADYLRRKSNNER